MRLVDELARLWNDTRSRMPQGGWSRTAWIWPTAAAVAGALLVLLGTSPPEQSAEARASFALANVADTDEAQASPAIAKAETGNTALPPACREQTWPFLTDECLRRDASAGAKTDAKGHVRVIHHDPAMEAAAIGATQWARKGTLPTSRQEPPRHKQAARDRDRTATARSGRRGHAARERTYAAPAEAFSAYGSAWR